MMAKIKTKYFIIGQSQKGFSLFEVILALFIISVSLMGVLALLSQTVAAGNTSSNRMVASNLAQEGVEIVKSLRDSSYAAAGWDSFFSGFAGTTDWIAQYNDSALRAYQDIVLKFDSTAGLYGYDSGGNSPLNLKRKITITKISDQELQVVILMTWVENRRAQSLTVEDRIWNWR